jgi:ribosomal protein S18 acetylase RimI-like enzyme
MGCMLQDRPYSVETATWRDLFALHTLEKACFQDDAWPLVELLGVLTFPGIVRLRVMDGGRLVGFIAGDSRRREQTGWIMTLGVLPEWRHRGIASILMDACEREMGMPVVKLTVRRGNQAAIHLYEKLGFRQVDIWSKYYHNGEDGLVLEKQLQSENAGV